MPPPLDLTELSQLRDIPGMIRGMGVPYTPPGPGVAAPGIGAPGVPGAAPGVGGPSLAALLSYLASVAPFATLGGAGLIQGGSADPNAQRFYEQRGGPPQMGMGPAPPMGGQPPGPMGSSEATMGMPPRFQPMPPRPGMNFAPIPRFRAMPPRSPAPTQPFQF